MYLKFNYEIITLIIIIWLLTFPTPLWCHSCRKSAYRLLEQPSRCQNYVNIFRLWKMAIIIVKYFTMHFVFFKSFFFWIFLQTLCLYFLFFLVYFLSTQPKLIYFFCVEKIPINVRNLVFYLTSQNRIWSSNLWVNEIFNVLTLIQPLLYIFFRITVNT